MLMRVNLLRGVYSLAFTGLLVLAGASGSAAQTPTYIENGAQGAGRQNIIISVAPGHESDVLTAITNHGGSVQSTHPLIHGVAASIDGSQVADLAKHGALAITLNHAVGVQATTSNGKGERLPLQPTVNPNTAPQPPTVSTLRATLGLPLANAGNNYNLAPSTSSVNTNGTGVRIAIIDSGIGSEYVPGPGHTADKEFADQNGVTRIAAFKDYTGQTSCAKVSCAYDDVGHGTHIAGLIAGSGFYSGYQFQGVAPNANLLILKVLGVNGGLESDVIHAIQDAITAKAQIINLSLGRKITTPAKFDMLVQAVEAASRAGVAVVISAGNGGPKYATISTPGNAPSAITVGAADGKTTITRDDDYVIGFSSRGPTWYDGFAKPDVIAPGVNLFADAAKDSVLAVSAQQQTTPKLTLYETVGTANLIRLSGTSMSAAVATGVVALEIDANFNQRQAPLTPNTARAILEYTAVKVVKADALTQGAGQINGAGAEQLAGSIDTTVQTGSWWLTSPVTPSSRIGSQTYTWAQNIIWGTSVIGGQFIFYKNLAWDDNIIWGTSISARSARGSKRILGADFTVIDRNIVFGKDDGDNIIWGTNLAQFRVIGERVGHKILWAKDDGDNIIWGTLDADNIIWGTDDGDNIIWGTWSGDGDNIIWGTTADVKIVAGASAADDNIIWGTSAALGRVVTKGKGISVGGANIVWATGDSDNIIWGTADADNIIWGTSDDNIIWGTDDSDNIIWGTDDGDNIIWGTSVGGLK